MSDLAIKTNLLRCLNAEPAQLAEIIAKTHRKNAPHLRIHFVVWMNAKEAPWRKGIELLELCNSQSVFDPDPAFRPVEFPPQGGWPRVRLILTSAAELNLDSEVRGNKGFAAKVERKLRLDQARVVLPHSSKHGFDLFEAVLRDGN